MHEICAFIKWTNLIIADFMKFKKKKFIAHFMEWTNFMLISWNGQTFLVQFMELASLYFFFLCRFHAMVKIKLMFIT